jgi:hypothetical protein
MTAIDDLNTALAVLERARMKIICRPEMGALVRARIRDDGIAGLVEVVESNIIDADKIYVFREPSGTTR